MRRNDTGWLLAVLLLMVGGVIGWLSAKAEVPAGGPSKVTQLMQKRLELAGSLSGLMNNAFAAGQVSASVCHEANLTYLDAEMELCTTDAERLKVQQKIVDAEKAYTAAVEKQAGAGHLMRTDVMKAELLTLEAEIRLEQLKAKMTAK